MNTFGDEYHRLESDVRVYNRCFPVRFARGNDYRLWDKQGREYIDFFSSAGSLNYGHNPPEIVRRVVDYMQGGGITTSLDMMTNAKYEFLDLFYDVVLRPLQLDYKVQFVGPTGTNAVEAALKIARLKTGRHTVVAFTNAFHGVSSGALAATGSRLKRSGAGIPLGGVFRLPYDGYMDGVDAPALLEKMIDDPSSGLDIPAAIILETIQAEGGINVASTNWLKRMAEIAQRHDIVLIVDDIQTGCGRTGKFFSFEDVEIVPDIVCLSKSISAMGFPMALVLLRPELDIWKPGQHNGTFRGNNLAFVAASAALECYWKGGDIEQHMRNNSDRIDSLLEDLGKSLFGNSWAHRGRGLIRGIEWHDKAVAKAVSRACFKRGLIVETCGGWDQVIKLLPPLTIDRAGLERGFGLLADSIEEVVGGLVAGDPTEDRVAMRSWA